MSRETAGEIRHAVRMRMYRAKYTKNPGELPGLFVRSASRRLTDGLARTLLPGDEFLLIARHGE
jgi:hypothetical protein